MSVEERDGVTWDPGGPWWEAWVDGVRVAVGPDREVMAAAYATYRRVPVPETSGSVPAEFRKCGCGCGMAISPEYWRPANDGGVCPRCSNLIEAHTRHDLIVCLLDATSPLQKAIQQAIDRYGVVVGSGDDASIERTARRVVDAQAPSASPTVSVFAPTGGS